MKLDDVTKIVETQFGETTLAFVILKDGLSREHYDQISDAISDIASETDTYLILLNESIYSDFKRLSYLELLALQEQVNEAVRNHPLPVLSDSPEATGDA